MSEKQDAVLGGRLRLNQPDRRSHRAGTDALLLAHWLSPAPGTDICDLGAGTGVVGLACAILRPGLRITLVERDPALAALARGNALLNGIEARIVEADILGAASARLAAGLTPESFDGVLTNPPFFEDGTYRPSPDPQRAAAHGFPVDGLDGWMRTSASLLRPGGQFGMIHRADALPKCLTALARRFGGIVVRPVHPHAGEPAIRVLIRAVKGSRAPFSLAPPLVLHEAEGRFTPEAAALHGSAFGTATETVSFR